MRQQLTETSNRRGCRPAVRHHRSVVELRARRYDHAPRPRGARRTPASESSPRSRTARLDTTVYQRRRRVAGLAVALAVTVLSLGAQAALTGPGSGPASAAGTGTAIVHRTVRVVPGDSLWSIAEEHHGDIDLSRYLDKLIDLNEGTGIEVGQLVQLP